MHFSIISLCNLSLFRLHSIEFRPSVVFRLGFPIMLSCAFSLGAIDKNVFR